MSRFCFLVSYETLASKSAVDREKGIKAAHRSRGDAGSPTDRQMRNKVAAAAAVALALVILRRQRQQAATAQRRDLAHVKFEVNLLEKQLELAQLEGDASRARHERDLRQAAVDAAQELSSASSAPVAPAPLAPRAVARPPRAR